MNFLEELSEKQDEAIENIAKFFEKFKQVSVARPIVKKDTCDNYFSSSHSMFKLIDPEANQTELFLYDKRLWCRGCKSDCQRYYNTLELRTFNSPEQNVPDFYEISVSLDHDITRNLSLIGTPLPLLKIRTWHEENPKVVRCAEIMANQGTAGYGGLSKQLNTEYEDTLKLVERIRKTRVK